MIAAAVVEELFAVIRSEGECAAVPAIGLVEMVDQARQLNIDPANAGVVEIDDCVSMIRETRLIQVGAVPVGIHIAGASCGQLSFPHGFERGLLRVVGRVRVHEVEPQEERGVANGTEPVKALINEDVGGGEAAQLVERSGRCAGPALAVLEVEFVVKRAHRTEAMTGGFQLAIEFGEPAAVGGSSVICVCERADVSC